MVSARTRASAGMDGGCLGGGVGAAAWIGALGGVGDNTWHAVRPLVLASSGLALVGAGIMAAFIRNGPFAASSPPFDMGQVAEVFRNRRLALANFGYLGTCGSCMPCGDGSR